MVVPVECLRRAILVNNKSFFEALIWKETDMVRDIGAFNFLVELVESHFRIIEFCVLEMQPGEVVEEDLLQFGFLARIAFH